MVVLVIGNYSTDHAGSIESAVQRAVTRETDPKISFVHDTTSAKKLLEEPHGISLGCVMIEGLTPQVEEVISWMRGQAHFFSVPVFILLPNLCEQAFRDIHSFGADDGFYHRDMGAITRRIALLQTYHASDRPPITQGKAIIAYPQRQHLRLFGRTLRNAGFDVSFAIDHHELMKRIQEDKKPKIIITSHRLANDGLKQFVMEIRNATTDSLLPIVVVGNEQQSPHLGSEVLSLESVELMSDDAPPDNLLFLINELLRSVFMVGKIEQRASERLLYGTLCAFRPAGALSSIYGYCYNISYEGMYVKTYDPPRIDTELWVEMLPPFELVGIHLRGRVVWTRLPDNTSAVTVPPGFGFRINFPSCPPLDLEKYQSSYKQLLHRDRYNDSSTG